MNVDTFYKKLRECQESSQRWNAIVEDIVSLYIYTFDTSKLFSSGDLWDFMFTVRENHLEFHSEIWNTFTNTSYNIFFKTVYIAMDDPSPIWWKERQYGIKNEIAATN